MDKENIDDEDDLYRRIPPCHYVESEDRVSSGAFKDIETSVDWAKHTTPLNAVASYHDNHLVSLKAKIPRNSELIVEHNPLLDNYSHSLIIGRKSMSVRRYLAQNCAFVIKREMKN